MLEMNPSRHNLSAQDGVWCPLAALAHVLFKRFRELDITTVLTRGDLLTSSAGQRYQGRLLSLARLIWPRWLIQTPVPR